MITVAGYITVEYDRAGETRMVPCALIQAHGGSAQAAFQALTGIDPTRIIRCGSEVQGCTDCPLEMPGIRIPSNPDGEDDPVSMVERCDTCQVYDSDEDAAVAVGLLTGKAVLFRERESRKTPYLDIRAGEADKLCMTADVLAKSIAAQRAAAPPQADAPPPEAPDPSLVRLRTRLGAADDPDAEVWEGTLAEWLATSGDPEDFQDRVRALRPGQVLRDGGGAAEPVLIERIDGACTLCGGQWTVEKDGIQVRCPTCEGTGDPKGYVAQVRRRLGRMDAQDREDLLEQLILRYVCGPLWSDDEVGGVPLEDGEDLEGGDLVDDLGTMLRPFHPDHVEPGCGCGHPYHKGRCPGTAGTVDDDKHEADDPNAPCGCTSYTPRDDE